MASRGAQVDEFPGDHHGLRHPPMFARAHCQALALERPNGSTSGAAFQGAVLRPTMAEMIGYKVELASLDSEVVRDAAEYRVLDDGRLGLLTDGTEVKGYASGDWITLSPVGRRLTNTWPPANGEQLTEQLHTRLCVGYGHCGRPVSQETLTSQLINDEDRPIDAVFEAAGAPLGDKRLRQEMAQVTPR